MIKASIDLRSLLPEAVERDEKGVPRAFRIWSSGRTMTDKGEQFFTDRSADLLLAQQSERGNLFSIDVDHLSLNPVAPPESRKAVGWHRLEVRKDASGAPELWANGVEWTDVVRAGLEKDPPEWRYFSPAYDVDKKTREVIGYLNTALTNNPATWGVTALASAQRGVVTMTRKEICSVLKHMSTLDGEQAAAVAGAIAALESARMEGEGDGDAPPKKEGDDEGEKKEKTSEEPPPKKDDDDEKKEAVAASADVLALAAKVQELSAWKSSREEAEERAKLMATRTDLDESVVKMLATFPIAQVREAVKTLPRGKVKGQVAAARAAADPGVKAARGAEQGTDDGEHVEHVGGYDPKALDEQMGLRVATNQLRQEGTRLVLGVMTPDQARATIKAREKEAGAQRGA